MLMVAALGNQMRYRRATTPRATYFFTVVTYQQQKVFHVLEIIKALRQAFRIVKVRSPSVDWVSYPQLNSSNCQPLWR